MNKFVVDQEFSLDVLHLQMSKISKGISINREDSRSKVEKSEMK